MMRTEFEEKLIEYAGEDNVRVFTQEEYTKIEYVYTWHPAIAAVGGKRQIALIWQEFGMGMIDSMYPLSQEMERLENKRAELRRDLTSIDNDIKAIKDNYR